MINNPDGVFVIGQEDNPICNCDMLLEGMLMLVWEIVFDCHLQLFNDIFIYIVSRFEIYFSGL